MKATTYKINLIELAKNGREKILGYTKITLNNDILNKKSKHKVVRSLNNQGITGVGEIISIL